MILSSSQGTEYLIQLPAKHFISWLERDLFSSVFHAKRLYDNRHVALKVFHATPEGEHLCDHECSVLKQIVSVPNTPVLLDGGRLVMSNSTNTIELPFLAEDWIEAYPLHRVNELTPRVDWRIAAHIGASICDTLEVLHNLPSCKGVIHRDLKPSNILIQETGSMDRVWIIDFDVARTGESTRGERLAILRGTPFYLAPESFLLFEQDEVMRNPALDIFSLGVILYHLTQGVYPHQGFPEHASEQGRGALQVYRTWWKHELLQHAAPAYPENLPSAFADAVMAALDHNPAERPAAAQLKGIFEALLADKPPVVSPDNVKTNRNSPPENDGRTITFK